MPDESTPWVVKGVPQWVRRVVKMYAVSRNMTMAEGLTEMMKTAVVHSKVLNRIVLTPELTQADAEAMGLDWKMVLMLREQLQTMGERDK